MIYYFLLEFDLLSDKIFLMKKLILIDGHSIIYRMWHVIKPLYTHDNIQVNAAFGFIRYVINILENEKPDFMCVVFDHKEKSFRHKENEGYKAQRPSMPKEFHDQVPIVQEWLNKSNIKNIQFPGWEADDVVGTISKKATNHHINTYIVSSDQDLFQLISPTISILAPQSGGGIKYVNIDVLRSEYDVDHPQDVIYYKALSGDVSDNIKGIKGMGKKTALKLIKKHGRNLEVILNDETLNDKLKSEIKENYDMIFNNLKIVTINCDVPVDFNEELFKFDILKLQDGVRILEDMNMNSISKKIQILIKQHNDSLYRQDSLF